MASINMSIIGLSNKCLNFRIYGFKGLNDHLQSDSEIKFAFLWVISMEEMF